MAFSIAPSIDGADALTGMLLDIYPAYIVSTTEFEDGLMVGRFAKLDSGSIDNLDESTTPVIAGVVRRLVTNPLEDEDTYTAENTSQIEYVHAGAVTVEVKSGETPTRYGTVYAYNVDGDDLGTAVTSAGESTGIDTGAEFLYEIDSTNWAVRLK